MKNSSTKSSKTISKRSIANKLVAIVMTLVIIIFVLTGFLINNRVSKIITSIVEKELMLGAEKTSETIDEYLIEKSQTVKIIAQSKNIIDYIGAARGNTNRKSVKKLPEYPSVLDTLKNIKASDSTLNLVYIALNDNNSFIVEYQNKWQKQRY